jgi:hypothetical protein
MEDGKKKSRIVLTITISADAAKGLDLKDLESAFDDVGKQRKDATTVDRKVEVIVM